MFQDDIENFLPSVSCLETRPRRILLRDGVPYFQPRHHNFCFHSCHFLTGHRMRRVKVKVAPKGLIKTMIRSSESSWKPFKSVLQAYQSLHTPTWESKFKPVSKHLHSEWEEGRRNLPTGSIMHALQTTPINQMLSFHASRFCLSQSQGSRRDWEFCPLNLEVRDENKIFYQYLRVRYETEIFSFKSYVSRWDFETRLT